WRMPPLISGEAVSLCQLGDEPIAGLELAIHTAVADIAAPAALHVRMEADNSQWTIRHLSDIEADYMGDPVATVRRDGLQILFAWAQPFADNRVRRELANCLLEIRHANDARVVQLR